MPLPLSFALSTDDARARQRSLQQRLRCGAIVAAGAVAGILGLAFHAYLSNGPACALALLIAGLALIVEALRQADRTFIAPLQAHCQADFSRQVCAALGPLLHPRLGAEAEGRTTASALRQDA